MGINIFSGTLYFAITEALGNKCRLTQFKGDMLCKYNNTCIKSLMLQFSIMYQTGSSDFQDKFVQIGAQQNIINLCVDTEIKKKELW